MKKYSFMYDYAEGAHIDVLEALNGTNYVQQLGYGEDEYCLNAANIIRKEIGNLDAEVHFVSGGTQANLLIISSLLRQFESVIAAKSGHIAVHETGAIEYTGHKINVIDTPDGKLTSELITPILEEHCDEHMVVPKLVYISNSSEFGSIYKKGDLEKLSAFCKENNLYLFMDGARLGTALTAKTQDLKMKDIQKYVDVFYIGGTKNGALMGEAIVLLNDRLKYKFRYEMKQKGALLAKGRLFGVQFSTLFTNNLYYTLAEHANLMASKMAEGIQKRGFDFLIKPETNIILPIFSNKLISKLEEKYLFYPWKKIDEENTCVRLVTSWATQEDKVNEFLSSL